jgi:hypothetical protein
LRGAFSFQPNTTWNPTIHTNIAATLQLHHAAVVRLAAAQVWGRFGTPDHSGCGPSSGHLLSPQELASWVGVCPGREQSAETSQSDESPKGNHTMRNSGF